MIVCASLEEATKVPDVILVVASDPPVAYQKGDALPSYAFIDPASITAEKARAAAIDANIKVNAIGAVQPASAEQLKAMTVVEYSAWFDANFTTAASLIALLKRLTLIVIRRVL